MTGFPYRIPTAVVHVQKGLSKSDTLALSRYARVHTYSCCSRCTHHGANHRTVV